MQIICNKGSLFFSAEDLAFTVVHLVYEEFHRSIPSHSHGAGSYEIHYISQGAGFAQVEEKVRPLRAGCLYITGPHIQHAQWPEPADPMCEYCIYLKVRRQKTRAPSQEAPASLIGRLLEQAPSLFLENAGEAGPIIRRLFQEIQEEQPGCEIYAESLLKQLLVTLARNGESQPAGQGRAFFSPAEEAPIIMEEYFLYEYHRATLQELSARLSLSPRQTERLIKRHYGKTFQQKSWRAAWKQPSFFCLTVKRASQKFQRNWGIPPLSTFPARSAATSRSAPGSTAVPAWRRGVENINGFPKKELAKIQRIASLTLRSSALYHSATEPSACRHTGFFQLCGVLFSSSTSSSRTSTPSPGRTGSCTNPSVNTKSSWFFT